LNYDLRNHGYGHDQCGFILTITGTLPKQNTVTFKHKELLGLSSNALFNSLEIERVFRFANVWEKMINLTKGNCYKDVGHVGLWGYVHMDTFR